MASNYRAEMSTPHIYPTDGMIGVLDQAKPSIFAAAIRQGDSYVRPSGNATFYFTVYRGGEVIQAERSLSLPVTTSEGTPPWSAVTVPANTFPADDDGWGAGGGLIVHYRITYSGWGGVVTVPLDDSGSLKIGYFGTIKPPRTVGMTPEGGAFVDDRAANTFRWNIEYNKDYTVSTPVAQASAVFQWRNGSSGTVNSVNVSGTGQSAVIPANTFPASTAALQWRISRVTMADGAVWEADADFWINLTTIDSLSTAQIVSPSGAYLTGNEENTFSWEHVIATGTAQTRADLQYSADAGESWESLAAVTGAAQSVIIPADTLPGGALLWRVRTCNSDGTAGEWSDPAPIVVYAAPPAPALLPVDPVPRPVLRWQSAEQQAFEARADGVSLGAVFGTAKEYRITRWLTDGAHTLGVRVQSSLGLWSEWSEVTITVSNVPPGAVALTARGVENGARLSWEAAGSFDAYLIYRDGEAIGETSDNSWTDWFANGRHRYEVRGVSGEYYALSNEVWEWSVCRWGALSRVDLVRWIPLRLRSGGSPSHDAESSRTVTLRYYDGRGLPVAEVSEFTDRTHTLAYTLRPNERHLLPSIRALLGKIVIYKNRDGARVTGVLGSLSEQQSGQITELTLAITETDWREYDAD